MPVGSSIVNLPAVIWWECSWAKPMIRSAVPGLMESQFESLSTVTRSLMSWLTKRKPSSWNFGMRMLRLAPMWSGCQSQYASQSQAGTRGNLTGAVGAAHIGFLWGMAAGASIPGGSIIPGGCSIPWGCGIPAGSTEKRKDHEFHYNLSEIHFSLIFQWLG